MDNVLCSILSRSSGCVQFGCVKLHNGRQLTRSECTKHSISWHSRTQRAVLQRSAATVFWVRTSYPRAHKLARRLTLTIQFPSSIHSSNTAIREVWKPCKCWLPVDYCACVQSNCTQLHRSNRADEMSGFHPYFDIRHNQNELLALCAGSIYPRRKFLGSHIC